MDKELTIRYQEFDLLAELAAGDRELLQRAVEATEGSYAPYSGFHVGAALRLADGTVVVGSNQENMAYPSGLCAERTAVFAASAQRPDCRDYRALAIVGRDAEGRLCEASPCGACRQVLSEYEQRQGSPLRVLCYLDGGGVRVFPSVASLLPFSFVL
jgi:cytidine deaminase